MFINLSYGAEIALFCMEVILKCQNSLTYFVDSRWKQVQNGVARHIIKGSVVPLIPKSKKTVKTHWGSLSIIDRENLFLDQYDTASDIWGCTFFLFFSFFFSFLWGWLAYNASKGIKHEKASHNINCGCWRKDWNRKYNHFWNRCLYP